MIYASRASLIICVLAFVYIFVFKNGKRGVSLRLFLAVACIVCAFIALAANGNIVIERLLEAGQDDGSLGRLRMWDYAIPTFWMPHYLEREQETRSIMSLLLAV